MFYCTAGRGTEVFVSEELERRQIDSNSFVTDGKVYFKCDQVFYRQLTSLKSVERVFVQIDHFNTSEINVKGRYNFLNYLKERLVKRNSLEEALHTYRHITQCLEITHTGEPDCKKPRTEGVGLSGSPTFRVSSKVAGSWGKAFRGNNCKEVSQHLGQEIVKLLAWKVELRNPEVEICVHINDEYVCTGIPISRHPVSKRSYIVQPGLRSTIAWIMAHLASIQTGDVVLDPMCGKATILVEASKDEQNGHYLGCDINQNQLTHGVENRQSSQQDGRLELAQASVIDLPLRDGCVDKVICDAPFGQKHKTDMAMDEFYQRLIYQIQRVLRPGGTAVVMTSSDIKDTLLSCINRLQSHHTDCQSQSVSLESKLNDIQDSQDNSTTPPTGEMFCKTNYLDSKGGISNSSDTEIGLSNEDISTNKTVLINTVHKSPDKQDSECPVEEAVVDQDKTDENTSNVKETVCVSDTTCGTTHSDSVSRPCLVVSREHYVKLGDTHAFIIVLNKENK